MDDRPTSAPAASTPPPQVAVPVPPSEEGSAAGPAETGGLFAVFEAVALGALGIDATEQSTPRVDDPPRPADNNR
jgi:hypothetical protein